MRAPLVEFGMVRTDVNDAGLASLSRPQRTQTMNQCIRGSGAHSIVMMRGEMDVIYEWYVAYRHENP